MKAKAALAGRKLKDVVAESLRAHLSSGARPSPLRRVEFPIIKGKGSVLSLKDEEIAEIEAREEADYHARFMRR